MHVLGIDVTRGRWIGVLVGDFGFEAATVGVGLGALLNRTGLESVVVDVPVGLPNGMGRGVDGLARRLLGGRASSVFPVPARVVLEQPSYREALAVARERYGRGVSRQAYALRGAILEVEAVARSGVTLFEGHPEVSFRAMKGEPLEYPKRSWNGMQERLLLLETEGIQIPRRLPEIDMVPPDDLLDAAALAWTAGRRATGVAERIEDTLEVSDRGRPMTIWY